MVVRKESFPRDPRAQQDPRLAVVVRERPVQQPPVVPDQRVADAPLVDVDRASSAIAPAINRAIRARDSVRGRRSVRVGGLAGAEGMPRHENGGPAGHRVVLDERAEEGIAVVDRARVFRREVPHVVGLAELRAVVGAKARDALPGRGVQLVVGCSHVDQTRLPTARRRQHPRREHGHLAGDRLVGGVRVPHLVANVGAHLLRVDTNHLELAVRAILAELRVGTRWCRSACRTRPARPMAARCP